VTVTFLNFQIRDAPHRRGAEFRGENAEKREALPLNTDEPSSPPMQRSATESQLQ
jgi:hypothetical protein